MGHYDDYYEWEARQGTQKWNGGVGALLCPDCRTIVTIGWPKVGSHLYCYKCKQKVSA